MHSYVAPAVELLYENGTPEFRGQWPHIEAQLELVRPRRGTGDWDAPYLYLGGTGGDAGRPGHRTELRTVPIPRLSEDRTVAAGVLHDNPGARVEALRVAGIDLQVISPGPSLDACVELGSALAVGMFGAYNQYVLAYCRAGAGRLKAAIQVHGAEPHWAAREIRDLAAAAEVAAVTVHLPVRLAPDDRNFRPIWEALVETDLPLLHRPSCGAKVWSPDRLLAYLVHSGVIDRYPALRIVFVESSAPDWLPGLVASSQGQHAAGSQRGWETVASLLVSGQVCAAVDSSDDGRRLAPATRAVGTACLAWQSHFPFGKSLGGNPALSQTPGGVSMAALSANALRFLAGRDAIAAGAGGRETGRGHSGAVDTTHAGATTAATAWQPA